MGRGGGREEGEEEEEEEARGIREGEGNGWEDATQVFPECSHPRLPNAKRPCTSQTELGNLHVGDKKSWAGKSSFFFGFSPPFPHTRPSFLYSLRNTCNCCAAQPRGAPALFCLHSLDPSVHCTLVHFLCSPSLFPTLLTASKGSPWVPRCSSSLHRTPPPTTLYYLPREVHIERG